MSDNTSNFVYRGCTFSLLCMYRCVSVCVGVYLSPYPGLAEWWIKFDDDMFLTSRFNVEDWFDTASQRIRYAVAECTTRPAKGAPLFTYVGTRRGRGERRVCCCP